MNLPQETLGFRRASFSLASRYSYRHSLSYAVQHSFRYAFSQRTMLLYRSQAFTPSSEWRVLLKGSGGFLQLSCSGSRRRLKVGIRKDVLGIFARSEQSVNTWEPEASVACFSPGHLRRIITRPVSYYALFK